MIDETHDPDLRCWVESAAGSVFPVQNLPFGVYSTGNASERAIGVAIGEQILDARRWISGDKLNGVMALSTADRRELRRRISRFLTSGTNRCELVPMAQARMQLPAVIGDYTDFYASRHHAENAGKLFRPERPLLPNYDWVPVAYHGRSSSIVVSGTAVKRPWGQAGPEPPRFQPTAQLDFELELGAFVAGGNAQGEPIPIGQAEDHVFGLCLLNDWSARDIQAWEYQPLGPFLGKNFATSISPWVVTAEALAPFRIAAQVRPETLRYLAGETQAFDIHLEVLWNGSRCTVGNARSLSWTYAQMIAHHTSNGCPLRPGDLLGSGTISGPEPESRGCLLERGRTGPFLQDGDEVVLRGWCEREGFVRIGLGECLGSIEKSVASWV